MTDDSTHAAAAGDAHGDHEGHHIVPGWLLTAVWAALIFLTILTVFTAQFHLGAFDVIFAMLIATVKAGLVCAFFMHLVWDRGFHSLLVGGALLFVFLFISFSVLDYGEMRPLVEAKEFDVFFVD